MYCLRWWIPLFLLPFPTAPPSFLILFTIAYVFHTRPCAYCGVIIIGLFISSCFWYLDLVPADAFLSPDEIGFEHASVRTTDGGVGSANQTQQEARGGGETLPQQVIMVAAAAALRAGSAAKVYLTPWLGSTKVAGQLPTGNGAQAQASGEATTTPRSSRSTGLHGLSNLLGWRGAKPAPTRTAEVGDSTSAHQHPHGSLSPDQPIRQSRPGRSSNHDLLAQCPGAGRCWFDFALMASHGLFEPSPCYRLPESGCKPIVDESSSSSTSASSPSSHAKKWPTFRELLAETTRQRQVQRAIQADIQRKIEEEQAEVIQAVVAEEADAAEAAARETRQLQDEMKTSGSSSSSSSSSDTGGVPISAPAAAAAARSRAERQSRARRIKSRSRKPAFRKADPEVDGEHTRGTYWIGVPGTAVGAFFDFSLR